MFRFSSIMQYRQGGIQSVPNLLYVTKDLQNYHYGQQGVLQKMDHQGVNLRLHEETSCSQLIFISFQSLLFTGLLIYSCYFQHILITSTLVYC